MSTIKQSPRPNQKKRHTALLIVLLTFATLCGGAIRPAAASPPSTDGFSDVVLYTRVVDRQGKAVSGARLHFSARLTGLSRAPGNAEHTRTDAFSLTTDAVTGPDGLARARFGPASPWFRGHVEAQVTPASPPTTPGAEPEEPISPLENLSLLVEQNIPASPGESIDPAARVGLHAAPVIHVYDLPDTYVDRFPVWLGQDGKMDRVVVLVEGFDLYNRYSATDNLRLAESGVDPLRASGVDVVVVNFADSHLPPDQLAPRVDEAVRAASRAAGGAPVAVVGLSAGGLASRWALSSAEAAGTPLPVHTLMLLDTPNRGANVNPALQAISLRYGTPEDRAAVSSLASRTLLRQPIWDISQADWERVGLALPLISRMVPTAVHPDTETFEQFYARLHALNDRNGYPKSCRVIGVANSARLRSADEQLRVDLLRQGLMYMWLPGNQFWTLPTAPADVEAGSLMPDEFLERFKQSKFNHSGGTYLYGAPTFLPTESALDAGLDETPPFDAWFALPSGSRLYAHDEVAPEVAAFVVRSLLEAFTAP